MNDITSRVTDSARSEFEWFVERSRSELAPLCKSPIEEMLGTALAVSLRLARPGISAAFQIATAATFDEARAGVTLVPQYRWGKYVIDFALHIPKMTPRFMFIECDGHEFHERTKEQAAHDRMKDRAIQTATIPVLRFTGSEIYRDPSSCALQIAAAVRGRLTPSNQQEGE